MMHVFRCCLVKSSNCQVQWVEIKCQPAIGFRKLPDVTTKINLYYHFFKQTAQFLKSEYTSGHKIIGFMMGKHAKEAALNGN